MSLVIYQMPHSPYCIPLTRAMDALGKPYEVVNIAPHTREEVVTASDGRFYQVPFLQYEGTGVGESTADSIDVPRFVDKTFAEGRLFPPAIEAAHTALIAFIENDLELAGFILMDPQYIESIEDPLARTLVRRFKERKFGLGCLDQWRRDHDELFARFTELLGSCETTLTHQPFLFGDSPVYADFALYGILGNVTYQGYNELPELPGVRSFFDRMTAFSFAS